MDTKTSKSLQMSLALPRASLRGLKKCPSCGQVNGQRALVCRNEHCELQKQRIPFDPVQLVDSTGSRLFSVRSKERVVNPRNFVKITEITLALEPDQRAEIVSRNAICFVDTCKYDASDVGIECKHIKACTVDHAKSKAQLPQAEVYTVSREVLFNLNIPTEQKQHLWEIYHVDEKLVPAVQKLNSTTFAVKCEQSKHFPAGRLHVTVAAAKRGSHACACKKLKIIVEPDNSVVMRDEICDHILLLLAAILSTQNGKNMYESFIGNLKSFWMPAMLETPLQNNAPDDDFAFLGPSIDIGGNLGECGDRISADDIFIFGEEFLTSDALPDISDMILSLTNDDPPETTTVSSNIAKSDSKHSDLVHTSDPNMVSSCNMNDEDSNMHFQDVQLDDCNIELMDQFQLTNQIDLNSEELAISTESVKLYDGIGFLSPPLSAGLTEPLTINTTKAELAAMPSLAYTNSISLLRPLPPTEATKIQTSPTPLPIPLSIELPTIAVEKKCPIKVTDVVAEVKTRKFPHLPAKRALIVNTQEQEQPADFIVIDQPLKPSVEPALAYSAWLENVIETINESVDIVDNTNISHTFNVHEEIFAHFSKSFSKGSKRRMPNSTTVVKFGKYKGLFKYTWFFSTASTVKRIFSTKNISLQIERAFECNNDGAFVPYIRQIVEPKLHNPNLKRIYPKMALYTAHIYFDCSNGTHKTGFKLEWLPNAFPKSHFGILNIGFSLGIKDPNAA